ncbi:hypothetical protein PSN45_002390 [Yamadazyma tenuis]|uniref:N-terminal nucleophile aminohydrolase n=1 Tax=Candida tenuis (strain ATCC 10573 / BCRC 21748 / CBS 615 / JCM 9827 / NBRC 10315 / NRRL Y-1498 / VKM Y-70) TaxID=590646 RepID=G3B0M5_CANTC|nr:uncharacterized protein CANTEDRAFT_129688 [Yamadazyma tenuis ATCC 10573]EGV65430.1 hypothetical protein CANTEDRAFT_129688 [Yamadazyma tenuis ATCC 10573]WEJ94889.1 hypothetical protein PSN45_002390 [Yamadazyma tenuis]
MQSPLLVLHIGAGNHPEILNSKYRQVIRKALSQQQGSRDGKLVVLAAAEILDECPLVNSGYGSSLNISGNVNNDASFLAFEGSTMIRYNCLYNIDHNYPLRETVRLFDSIDALFDQKSLDSIGLVKPKVLDYTARHYVYQQLSGDVVNEPPPIHPSQQRFFDKYKNFLEADAHSVQDTIGLIHIDGPKTHLAASSGGNFLKLPGRVGCAAVVGAGVGYRAVDEFEVSCLCSGNGEDIILLNLANFMTTLVRADSGVDSVPGMVRQAWESIRTLSDKLYVGVVLVINDKVNGCKRLIYYHTTETFYFGYHYRNSKVVLSRLTGNYVVGEVILR